MYERNEHRQSFRQPAFRQIAEPCDQGVRLAEPKVIAPSFLVNVSLGALGLCESICVSNLLIAVDKNIVGVRGDELNPLTSYVSGARRNWCLSAPFRVTFLVW